MPNRRCPPERSPCRRPTTSSCCDVPIPTAPRRGASGCARSSAASSPTVAPSSASRGRATTSYCRRPRRKPARLANVAAMSHPFLSAAWVDAARAIRERHAPDGAPIPTAVTINLIVNDSPFGDEPINSYVDTTSGTLVIALGQLADAAVTVTTDYETARTLFLATDPAAGMQAFMAGKLVVQGDMMKLVALPMMAASDPAAQAATAEIRGITD